MVKYYTSRAGRARMLAQIRSRKGRPVKRFAKAKRRYNARSDVITYMSPSRMPFPPRYRTIMSCEVQSIVPSATAASGRYACGLNYLIHPFITVSGSSPFPVGTLPTVASLNPTGLTQIFNNAFYNAYRVYGSAIYITCCPTNGQDIIEMTVTPSGVDNLPATTTSAMSQPYTKDKMFAVSKAIGKTGDILSNYITQHKFCGVTRRAVEDDLSGAFTGSLTGVPPPNNQLMWVINWNDVSGVNLNGNLLFTVRIKYYVEFWLASLPRFATT